MPYCPTHDEPLTRPWPRRHKSAPARDGRAPAVAPHDDAANVSRRRGPLRQHQAPSAAVGTGGAGPDGVPRALLQKLARIGLMY
jgi:hypothetical protein